MRNFEKGMDVKVPNYTTVVDGEAPTMVRFGRGRFDRVGVTEKGLDS